MTAHNTTPDFIAVLKLDREPFSSRPDLIFYYEYETIGKAFALLKRLVRSREIIVLVIGKQGNGKTLLLKRYLTDSIASWKSCRIRIHPRVDADGSQPVTSKDVDSYPAYVLQDATDAIIRKDQYYGEPATQ